MQSSILKMTYFFLEHPLLTASEYMLLSEYWHQGAQNNKQAKLLICTRKT